MTEPELKWLADEAQKHQRIVEIGSYLGRSTRALGDNTKGFVLAVDNFLGPWDVLMEANLRKLIYPGFLSNLKDLIDEGRVKPLKAEHDEVEIDFAPDMVFIDGDHQYESVKRDIGRWLPQIKGLLCGHDIHYGPVIEAVRDTLGEYNVAPDTTIWWKIIK